MTVASALAARSHQLEYILAIEGVGWLKDETDYSQGFEGDVFVTADLNGDIASQIGSPTIHHGLEIPSSISDRLDPITAAYTLSGGNFVIQDVDDWWSANFIPHSVGNRSTLSANLLFGGTTVSSNYEYAAGDIIWVGGREAIKLGTKAGAGPWTYSSSTRAYLGTPEGSGSFDPYSSASGFAWLSGATTDDVHRFWFDRSVALYLHVPGESAANLYLLWLGKLRGIDNQDSGLTWRIQGVGDIMRVGKRNWSSDKWTVRGSKDFWDGKENWLELGESIASGPLGQHTKKVLQLTAKADNEASPDGRFGLASFYHYRCTNGGTAGMKLWDPEANVVQAYDYTSPSSTSVTDVIGRFLKVGGSIFWVSARSQFEDSAAAAYAYGPCAIECSSFSFNDKSLQETGSWGTPVTDGDDVVFMLDNWSDNYKINRYAVDGTVRRHPVDVFLCHMLTMNNEFYIGDTTGTPTTTVLQFGGSPGWSTDQWVGYALHGVEQGAVNQFEARIITANTSDTITVSPPFLGGTPSSGQEFQIRNALYDVLPLGWGLGVHHSKIDVAAFEELRDTYLQGAEVGKYMLGLDGDLDLLDTLTKMILKPYGIALFIDGTTHKITPRYIGHPFTDGVIEDYVAIANADIMTKPSLDYQLDKPLGGFDVNVRAMVERPVEGYRRWSDVSYSDGLDGSGIYRDAAHYENIVYLRYNNVPDDIGGRLQTIQIRSGEVENGRSLSEVDIRKVESPLNTVRSDSSVLLARLSGLLLMYQVPPVRAKLRVAAGLVTQISIGKVVTIAIDSWPVNPFATSRGWTAVVGRVVGTQFGGKQVGLDIDLELLQELPGGLIAPACGVSDKGGPVSGNYYFDVEDTDYTFDSTDKDWYNFAVGDVVYTRLNTGARYDGPFTIAGFGGASQAASQSTPQGATPSRIWVGTSAIAGSYAGGTKYLTYTAYSAALPANQKKHATYANASNKIDGGATSGFKYGV